jgi:hypothetical protein
VLCAAARLGRRHREPARVWQWWPCRSRRRRCREGECRWLWRREVWQWRGRARAGGAEAERTRVRQLEAEEQLHSVQGDDVQEGRARCERSCNAAAAGGTAQEAVESRVEDVEGR